MNRSFIDLSVNIESSLSEPEPVRIERVCHKEGARILTKNTGISPESFPEGMAVNLERISLTSHSGTHVDAPLHYGPYFENKTARSIDQLPLDWFFGRALMLDCEKQGSSEPVQREEIEEALERQKLQIREKDIILIHTGADKLWGSREYFTDFRGMGIEALKYLLDFGVKVIGIDSFGFDPPFHRMTQEFKKTNDPGALWPCHLLGRKREYCQIERLTNLSLLPRSQSFLISCFPLKLKGCGAGPSRVVAIVNKEITDGL